MVAEAGDDRVHGLLLPSRDVSIREWITSPTSTRDQHSYKDLALHYVPG